jgi:hypothetical protein
MYISITVWNFTALSNATLSVGVLCATVSDLRDRENWQHDLHWKMEATKFCVCVCVNTETSYIILDCQIRTMNNFKTL